MDGNPRALAIYVAALAAALLLVGLVSATPLRHLIQATPPAIAVVLLSRNVRWAPYAALAICGFWLLIMGLIWLYLLGLARVVTGTFTPSEIVLTIAIGAASLLGIAVVLLDRPRVTLASGVLGFVCFALLQIAAVWVSVQPFAEHR